MSGVGVLSNSRSVNLDRFSLSNLGVGERFVGKCLALVTVACTSVNGLAVAEVHNKPEPPWESCADVAHYYHHTHGLEGEALRNKLFKIVRNHRVLSYHQTWDALKLLDAADSKDPEASSEILEIYAQKVVSKSLAGKPHGWNREHLWPSSYGLKRGQPEFTDLHNLRPSDANVNSARGKKYFGECTPAIDKTCLVPAFKEAAADTATSKRFWMPPLKAWFMVFLHNLQTAHSVALGQRRYSPISDVYGRTVWSGQTQQGQSFAAFRCSQ